MTRKCSCFPSAYTAAAAAAGPPPIIIRSYIAILLIFYQQYSSSHSFEGEGLVLLGCCSTTCAARHRSQVTGCKVPLSCDLRHATGNNAGTPRAAPCLTTV